MWRIPLLMLLVAAGNAGLASSGQVESAPPLPSRSVGRISWAIADFDGDSKPDVAITRMEARGAGYVYWLELELSTTLPIGSSQPGTGIPAVASSIFGLHLTPRDVDGDHDLDIVVTAGVARQPVAVWINDGKGRFEEGDLTAYPALTLFGDLSLSSQSARDLAPNLCDQGQRSRFGLPFGSSLQDPFLRTDVRLVWPPAPPVSHFLADRSSPRAPPSYL